MGGGQTHGPSLTLIPVLASTFADPLLPGPSSPGRRGRIDMRDPSQIAGAKSLTAEAESTRSLECEV